MKNRIWRSGKESQAKQGNCRQIVLFLRIWNNATCTLYTNRPVVLRSSSIFSTNVSSQFWRLNYEHFWLILYTSLVEDIDVLKNRCVLSNVADPDSVFKIPYTDPAWIWPNIEQLKICIPFKVVQDFYTRIWYCHILLF